MKTTKATDQFWRTIRYNRFRGWNDELDKAVASKMIEIHDKNRKLSIKGLVEEFESKHGEYIEKIVTLHRNQQTKRYLVQSTIKDHEYQVMDLELKIKKLQHLLQEENSALEEKKEEQKQMLADMERDRITLHATTPGALEFF